MQEQSRVPFFSAKKKEIRIKFTYCLLDKEVISAWEIQTWVGKSSVTSSENREVAILARFSYTFVPNA